LGLSCSSGPVGDVPGLEKVSIGDTIRYGDYSFRVGLIEVTRFNKDFSWGGTEIARTGELVCVLAADKASLPREDDCDALWIRAAGCRARK
jgi:hypothetical protein